MTIPEFSNEFDTLLNSYRRFVNYDNKQPIDTVQFDEYEKSLFLTQAQEALIIGLYDGTANGDSFETSEKQRVYLQELVREQIIDVQPLAEGVTNYSKLATLPEDIWFSIYEDIKFEDTTLGCMDNTRAIIKPVTHDTVYTFLRNPFKGSNKRRVLRLSISGASVELISKYNITNYYVRYLTRPEPIILVDLTGSENNIGGRQLPNECKLNSSLHRAILEKAVSIARSTLGAGNPNIV